MTMTLLHQLVVQSAARMPENIAISAPDGELTYAQLDRKANQVATALKSLNVQPGDRVGIWLEKSAKAVVVMQGALRVGAVYVPLDPLSPPQRISNIVGDCDMRVVVTQRAKDAQQLGYQETDDKKLLTIEAGESSLCWDDLESLSADPVEFECEQTAPAYILYTSGSTGRPKGVCISHRNALAFVEWAVDELRAMPTDRFANHAPFHFDLSVLDLYAAFWSGATISIVPELAAYVPGLLVDYLTREKPTIWYSVPSALILMMEHGGFLDLDDPGLRIILFAGEPFPIKHLRRLQERWPSIRLLNLYGPTETNVCTFYEVKSSLRDRAKPVPIGKACSGDRVWSVGEDGSEVSVGQEGELMASGPTVMLGYWGQPRHSGPYPTGDLVVQNADGDYEYIGRRDHMVKVRGHRIELGDIEATLLAHPAVKEAAVVVTGHDLESEIVAVMQVTGKPPSLVEVKTHCSQRLPRYMIVDRVEVRDSLPRTRNGKIDRVGLHASLNSSD